MSYAAKLRTLSGASVSQWGLITTAQSEKLGITRLDLSRLCQAEHLIRVRQGVYLDAGVSSTDITYLQAEWLMLKPEEFALDRLSNLSGEPVVASATAAWLHGAGDFLPTPFTFYSKDRIQRAANYVRISKQSLADSEVKVVRGLPTTTPERTVFDLLREGFDLGGTMRVIYEMNESFRSPRQLFKDLSKFAKHYGQSLEGFNSLLAESLKVSVQFSEVAKLAQDANSVAIQFQQAVKHLPKISEQKQYVQAVENLQQISKAISSLPINAFMEEQWNKINQKATTPNP
jgi:hypothetical protein